MAQLLVTRIIQMIKMTNDTFVCMHVCVVYTCAGVAACADQRLALGCLPQLLLHFIFGDRVPALNWELTFQLDWLAMEPAFCRTVLLSAGVTGAPLHPAFTGCLRSELKAHLCPSTSPTEPSLGHSGPSPPKSLS